MTTDRQELIDGIRKRHEAVERKTPGVAPCLEPQIHADRATLLELLSGSWVGDEEGPSRDEIIRVLEREIGAYVLSRPLLVECADAVKSLIDHRVAQATKAERERCPFVGFDDDNLVIQWRNKGILIGIHSDGTAWLSLKREGHWYATGETPISAVTLESLAQAIRSTP